jgi:hypothetical protein
MSEEVQDSWESRISAVSKIIGISVSDIEKILNGPEYRISKSDPNALSMLSDEEVTPFGDFRRLFCDNGLTTIPKLRLAMKYFRGPTTSSDGKVKKLDVDVAMLKSKYGVESKIEDIPLEELLRHYDPKKKNAIFNYLKERFKDKKMIAFDPDDSSKVAIEETLNYIADLDDGLPSEKTIEVKGEFVELYAIGNVPSKEFDEDPLYVGHPLKRGRSTFNHIDWKNIDLERKQFMRLLAVTGQIKPENRIDVRKLLDLPDTEIKKIYPEIAMIFKKQKQRDELPKLKIYSDSNRINDPFK